MKITVNNKIFLIKINIDCYMRILHLHVLLNIIVELEVLGSNRSPWASYPDTFFRGFHHSLQVNAVIVFKLVQDNFFLHIFQFFNHLIIHFHSFIHSFISGSTAPLLRQMIGLHGRGISPSEGRYLHAGQHKQNKRTHRHPYFEWDSNS
jgi:hypothetical protein